jgi:hypothetical protein
MRLAWRLRTTTQRLVGKFKSLLAVVAASHIFEDPSRRVVTVEASCVAVACVILGQYVEWYVAGAAESG